VEGVGEIIDIGKVRRNAQAAKRHDDEDFLAFCDAVGKLAGLTNRGRNARAYARALDYDEAVIQAVTFLQTALR
jgi:hypothetical protein